MNNDMTLNALHVASNNTFLMMFLICKSPLINMFQLNE